jgi:DDE superfamily endonuclease
MTKEPYASARRVFWIVDNGSSHRGQKAVDRLERRWPNLVLVHLPVHASWLNQIEIYFSIVQRKLLEPNDFETLPTSPATSTPSSTAGTRSPSPSSGTSPATTSPRWSHA